ncbi:SDR family NAD(P)-dependent oxidoreductase [Actinomadura sp. B10D3]|uniref:SDR family NAD(P)-dependent oxidoreductase n=1 Tax=Actinomadura sp. B10D3 TaxID=3153557 RepID=UPI00325F1018
MDIDLTGRTAFVSGSTQGIGRAIAAGLARSGATTVINGRSEKSVAETLQALRDELPGAGLRGVAELRPRPAAPSGWTEATSTRSSPDLSASPSGTTRAFNRMVYRQTACGVASFQPLS